MRVAETDGFVPLQEPARLVPDFRFDTSASTNLASTRLGACPSSAQLREVAVVLEMLVTEAEQVSRDSRLPPV
jgi:hypothetical protein